MAVPMSLRNIAAGDSIATIEKKLRAFCLPYGNIVGFRLIVDDRRFPLSGIAVVEFERRDRESDFAPFPGAIPIEGRTLISFGEMAR